MRSLVTTALFVCFVLTSPSLLHGQVQQEVVWNGSGFSKFGSVNPPAATHKFGKPVSVDDFLVIRGKFYDDDDGPIAIFVTLTDNNNRVITKYLAQVYDKSEKATFQNGADVLLFGPQFYDGYEVMKAKFTVYRLGKSKAQKIVGQIKKYMAVVPTFIPGLSLTNHYTDFAMQLVDDLIDADKKKSQIAEFELPFRGLDDNAAVPQKWYVFAQGKIATVLTTQTSYPSDSTFDLPTLPPGTKVDGTALLVGASRKDADTSYREILDRLKAIETSASDEIRSKIPIPAVVTGDARADQLMLDHLWFALFAKLKFSPDKDKSRVTIKGFFRDVDTLSQLINGGPPTGAYVKLSDEKERLLTQQLIGVFGYRVGTDLVPDNLKKPAVMFTSLEQWRNWFNRRCDLQQETDPCTAFDWKGSGQQQAPYVIATDRYVVKRAEDVKKILDDQVAQKPADNKILLASEFKGSLSGLLKFFQEQPDEPWMFFEQVSVARWIKQKFALKTAGATGDDLPDVTNQSDPDQVRAFAAKLRTAISETKVLKFDGVRYAAYPITNYVWNDLFSKKLNQIKATEMNALTVNQHELLKQAYSETIGKFWPQMSADEKAVIKEKFTALLSEQLQKEYAANESDAFFENNILKVKNSIVQPIATADPELLVTLAFYRGYRTDPSQFLRYLPDAQRKALVNFIERPPSLAAFSRVFVAGAVASGKPISVRQRAVKFLQEDLVPSLLEHNVLKNVPQNAEEATAWQTAFTTFVNSKSWDAGCKCFGGNQSTSEDLEKLRLIGENFKTLDENTSSDDLKEVLRSLLTFRFPEAAEPKTTEVKNMALSLLASFTGLSVEAQPEIKDSRSFWEQRFLADTVSLDIKKCQISGAERNTIVVRGQPCPGAAPSPVPSQ